MTEGYFSEVGVITGFGRQVSKEGWTYIGEFSKGLKHGFGTLWVEGKEEKRGEWELDEYHEFEEVHLDDHEADEEPEEAEVKPMDKEEIQKLIFGKMGEAIEQNFVLKRQKVQYMDKMGGLYVPFECRDQFYHLRVHRQWRFIIYKLNEEEPNFVEIQ